MTEIMMSEEQTNVNEMARINEVDTPQEVEVEKDKAATSTKLVMAAVVMIVGIAIALYKGDIPEHLLQLLEVVFGGFVMGNVANTALGVAVEHAEVKYGKSVEEDIPVSVISTQVPDLVPMLEKQAASLDLIQQTLLMIIKKAGLDK